MYPNISSHWSEGFKELKYFRSKKAMKKEFQNGSSYCLGPGFCYTKSFHVLQLFLSELRTSIYKEIHCIPTARGDADSKLHLLPGGEGFQKFQELIFSHLLEGNIHFIVIDKLSVLLTACNGFGSWDEVTG